MTIVWTKDLNTGIDVIDEQHKSIADYINNLERAIKQQDRTAVGQVLDELVDYTLSHFAFEESLQEEAGGREPACQAEQVQGETVGGFGIEAEEEGTEEGVHEYCGRAVRPP